MPTSNRVITSAQLEILALREKIFDFELLINYNYFEMKQEKINFTHLGTRHIQDIPFNNGTLEFRRSSLLPHYVPRPLDMVLDIQFATMTELEVVEKGFHYAIKGEGSYLYSAQSIFETTKFEDIIEKGTIDLSTPRMVMRGRAVVFKVMTVRNY